MNSLDCVIMGLFLVVSVYSASWGPVCFGALIVVIGKLNENSNKER